MRVFRRTYRDDAGKLQKVGKWYVEFKDHHDLYRRIPGTVDKAATETIGRYLDRVVANRIARAEPSGDVAAWLESAPPSLVERLAAYDLIDPRRLASGQLLEAHVDAYATALRERGRSAKHVDLTIRRVRRVATAAGVRYWSQLTADAVSRGLAKVQADDGFSDKTRNAYVTALRAFCTWMVKQGRATTSAAATLERAEVQAAEFRRALQPEEARWLLDTTTKGPERGGTTRRREARWSMSGATRALLYRFAIETSLRRGTIARLTCADLDAGPYPAVTVRGAKATKEKKTRTIPLRRSLADALKAHVAGRLPATPLFTLPSERETAAMVRADLEAARAAWIAAGATADERAKRASSDFLKAQDADGRRVDFHALRTTTGTWLDHAGVADSVARKITGHSSDTVLRRHYHRADVQQAREALEQLPELGVVALRPTGTDTDSGALDRPTVRNLCGDMRTDDAQTRFSTLKMPVEGLEPTLDLRSKRILNPPRLPIPPHRLRRPF